MSKQLSPDDVCGRLFSFIGSKGIGLSKSDQAEIRARVMGHSDAAAQARYDARAGQFFVLQLDFEDVNCEGGVTLGKTLSRLPLQESESTELARILAQQEAALQGQPVVLCDGNYENVEVVDEPPSADTEAYAVYQALGAIHDANGTRLDDSMAEDFTWDERYRSVRETVVGAKRLMAQLVKEVPPDELNHHLVLVVDEPRGKVLWRLYC